MTGEGRTAPGDGTARGAGLPADPGADPDTDPGADRDASRFRLDERALREALAGTVLAGWSEPLIEAVRARGPALRHGDLPRWRAALARLPALDVTRRTLDRDVVAAEGVAADEETGRALREALLELVPWRKGPFRLGEVEIDCEWRSDRKWARLEPHIRPLAGRTVLDVGTGSGYHLWRMRGAGAAFALGIEPGLLSAIQFEAVSRYLREPRVRLLPLTLETLPRPMASFDTVFSMGVLYHRREPARHLAELRDALRPGGELVLETLVAPGSGDAELAFDGRYARMRNVHALPSVRRLERWAGAAGFVDARVVSLDVTGTDEQRRTPWMPYDSLADALDEADPSLTVEGHPRPTRAVLVARRED